MEKRNLRKERIGVVTSNKMMKSIVVSEVKKVKHPMYGKFVLKTKKYVAHDEKNDCNEGDKVRIMNVNRLKKDHELAKMFANHISQIPEIIVNSNEVETNMVYIKLPESMSLGLQDYLYKKDILISPPKLRPKGSHRIVFHKDIDRIGVEKLLDLIFSYLKSNIH